MYFRLAQGKVRGGDHRSIQCRVRMSDRLRQGRFQRPKQRLTPWTACRWKKWKMMMHTWTRSPQPKKSRPTQRALSTENTRALTAACPSIGDILSSCTRWSTRNLAAINVMWVSISTACFSINVVERSVTTLFCVCDVCSCVIKSSNMLLHCALTWHDTSSRAATEQRSASPRRPTFPRVRETMNSRTRHSRRTPRGSLFATSAERPCPSCTLSGSTCLTTLGCDLTAAKCAASHSQTSTAWASTARCTGSPSSSSVNTARSYL